MRLKPDRKWLWLVLIVVIGWMLWSYLKKGMVFTLVTSDTEVLVLLVRRFGVWSGLAFVLITILEVVVAPIPCLVLYMAGGILFGPFVGGTLALLGNAIGAAICYKIAEAIGREWAERQIDEKKRLQFQKFSKKYGGWAIFLLRVNPLTSSDLFSYLAGLTRIRFSHFLIGTTLGLLPLVYFQTFLGENWVKNNPTAYLVALMLCVIYIAVFLYGVVRLCLTGKDTQTNRD